MADNPALRARGQGIALALFDGRAATAPGVVRNYETSAGDSRLPFGDLGAIAFIDYDGDGLIEFATYNDPATGDRLHRRVIRHERVGTIFATVKLYMASDFTVLPPGSFSERDFSSLDFDTGRDRDEKRIRK